MEEKSTTKKEYNHGKPSVFVGGLKDEADEDFLVQYVKNICPESEFSIIKDTKRKSRGFGFATFETEEQAIKFVEVDHFYQGDKLECKLSLKHEEYINANLKC